MNKTVPHKTAPSLRAPAALALALSGLLVWSQLSKPTTPVTVIAGLDASRSVRVGLPGGGNLLSRSRATLAELAGQLQPGLDRLVVAKVERETREFFDQAAPAGSEAFLHTLIEQTKTEPASDSTRPAKFWTLAARRAEQTPGVAIAIVLLSDGDNDDFSASAKIEMQKAARALAANRRVVSVEFFGADAKNWETIRTLFAPLGARLHLRPVQTMSPDELLARLEAARHQAERSGAGRTASSSRS